LHQIENPIDTRDLIKEGKRIVAVFNELGDSIDIPEILLPRYNVIILGE